MEQPSLQIGGGDWAVKETKLLGTNPILNRKLPVEMDFTNSTIGSRVNKEGFIENGPRNLLTFSEDFSNGVYVSNDLTIITNNTLSPNNTLTADKIVASTINRECILRIRREYVKQTYSIFAKKAELENLIFRVNVGGIWNNVVFNLSSGNITVNQSPTALIAKVVSLPNGWYRCILTVDLTNTTNNTVAPIGIIVSNNTNHVFTGNVGDGLYLWGAQLEQGSVATEYYPTTTRLNIPRIDYSSGSPTLLLEPQRTNLITWSTDLSNTAWIMNSNIITFNQGVSPDGLNNAVKIVDSGSGLQASWLVYNSLNVLNHTRTIWAKTVSGTGFTNLLSHNSNANSLFFITNEWQRFEVNSYNSTGANSFYAVDFRGTENTLSEILIWQPQAEVGTYASSEIFTQGAAVTRNGDNFSRGMLFQNGILTDKGGTWFSEFKNNIPLVRDQAGIGLALTISGGYSDGFIFKQASINRIRLIRKIGITESQIYETTKDNSKLAFKWDGQYVNVFENGVKVVSNFSFGLFNLEVLSASSLTTTIRIASIDLFNTPLTDAECIELTTI